MKQLLYLFLIISLAGCTASKETVSTPPPLESEDTTQKKLLPEPEEFQPAGPSGPYQPSATRTWDLVHTVLRVEPVWQHQHLKGQANLLLTPYFYNDSIIILDAKGFDLHQVALTANGDRKPLKYTYDSLQLKISLNNTYTRKDTLEIFIEYTAKPEELDEGLKHGQLPEKGLYFINPLGTEQGKPTQLWTQGEVQMSSAWFPTIDQPNERTTQEIYITAADSFVTLSNGVLVKKQKNRNNTITWHWKLEKSHAPYLFMMAIGKFEIVEDKWKNLVLEYYLEPEFAQYAQDIFGTTPDMLEFFTEKLNTPFPWPKYAQIVVRDFVSGAMENSGASVYFEALNKSTRDLIDENYEDFIAHELFHQWFGDLVTPEAWSQIALSEALATYGEYLWFEHSRGRDFADMHLQNDLQIYFQEANYKQMPLIRYHYNNTDELFDAHSYQKGGRIIHMLRKYVGDEAFFAALHYYLEKNKWQAVEVSDFREAFEEVTGQDLNWFFDQWFMTAGHPVIDIQYSYGSGKDSSFIVLSQKHTTKENFIYRIPMTATANVDGEKYEKQILLDSNVDSFYFSPDAQWININVEDLLAEINNQQHTDQWIFQYKNATLAIDRYQALNQLADQQDNAEVFEVFRAALDDTSPAIRKQSLQLMDIKAHRKKVQPEIIDLARNDPESSVRAAAIIQLSGLKDTTLIPVFEQAVGDSSYYVLSEALYGVYLVNPKRAMELAMLHEEATNYNLVLVVAEIFSNFGDTTAARFFLKQMDNLTSWERYTLITYYGNFLERMENSEIILKGAEKLKVAALSEGNWFIRYNIINTLKRVLEQYQLELSELRANEPQSARTSEVEQIVENIKNMLQEIAEQETHPTLKKILQVQSD